MTRCLGTFIASGYVHDADGSPLERVRRLAEAFIAARPGRILISLQVSTCYEPGSRPENLTATTEGLLTYEE